MLKRTLALLVLVSFSSIARADFLNADVPVRLGSGMYSGTFYELTGGIESVAWPSSGGKSHLFLSSIDYHENRGVVVNFLVMLFALAGGGNFGHYEQRGDVVYHVMTVEDQEREREYYDNVVKGSSSLPFSLDLRFYHDAIGSDVNGYQLALLFNAWDSVHGAVQVGLGVGHVGSNRNSDPPAMPMMTPTTDASFSHTWVSLETYVHADVGPIAAYGHVSLGTTSPALVLVELGPEWAIGNRFVVRGVGSLDFGKFSAGGRLEAGVRF